MFKRKRLKARTQRKHRTARRAWVSVGTPLTFRAEVMPGREPERRTFAVARVLDNGRVELRGLSGEHAETEFEPLR